MTILEEGSGSSRIKIKQLPHKSCLFQLSLASIISICFVYVKSYPNKEFIIAYYLITDVIENSK